MRARLLFRWSTLGWLFSSLCLPTLAATPLDDERLLKAAFVFNFAKLTDWPATTWRTAHAPFNLCTLGQDQLSADLHYLIGQKIKGRQVAILAVNNVTDPTSCHLLYVAQSEHNNFAQHLATLGSQAVLSVSEIADFAHNGGAIELYREDQRTRFLINLENARKQNLHFSSRLLKLATVLGKGGAN